MNITQYNVVDDYDNWNATCRRRVHESDLTIV